MVKRLTSSLLLLVFTLASCRTWVPFEGIPDPVPPEVRVHLVSGERAELMETQRQGDDLVGRVATTTQVVRIPFDEILHVARLQFSAARTTVLVLGVALVLGIGWANTTVVRGQVLGDGAAGEGVLHGRAWPGEQNGAPVSAGGRLRPR